jgi:hypothetical protein
MLAILEVVQIGAATAVLFERIEAATVKVALKLLRGRGRGETQERRV